MASVHLLITIDTECDKGPGWKTKFPLSFESVTHGVPEILMPLFRKFDILPTFLLSPEVIGDENCVAILRSLDGCELGTHLHGEFIEPEADFTAAVTNTPQSAYTPEVEWEKLSNLSAKFEASFGRKPLSFRGGRFALSRWTLGFLDRLGYRVDSTVTPFRTNTYGGGLRCNYWGAPLHPYHPSEKDPRCHGRLRLVEVPVTILSPRLARWPAFLLRRLDGHRARYLSRIGIDPGSIWIRPFRGTAAELTSWADLVIRHWRWDTPAVINVMFHSVEVIPKASPYAQDERAVMRLVESLHILFQHLFSAYRTESVGLSDVHALYRQVAV